MKRHFARLLALLPGVLLTPTTAQDTNGVPPGWMPGKAGAIYLRLEVSPQATHPVYLEGMAGWNWPRPTFCFFAAGEGYVEARANWKGDPIRPDGQPFQNHGDACIPPGGQTPWIEIPAASLGREWENRVTLKYPGALPRSDVPVTLVIASRPDAEAASARKSFEIGPSQTTVTVLFHRRLQGEVARTFTEFADETQRLARERLAEPVFGRRPVKFPCLTTLGLDRAVYPRVWETEMQTLTMLGMNGIWFKYGADLERAGFVHNEVQAFLNGTLEEWGWFPTNGQAEAWVKAAAARIDEADSWGNVGALHTIEEIGAPPLATFIMETPREKLVWGAKRHSPAFYRERFIDYLKEQGLTPRQLDKSGWEDIRIVDRDECETEPFLFYHSARFRTWTLSNVIRQLDEHYPRYFAKPLYTINMTSDAFMGTGSMTAHGVDLLHSIRLAPGVRDMGVEGWKNLTASYQFLSWEMEMIRCGTRHKAAPGLQLAAIMHRRPVDLEFSVYSCLAHGMNYLSYFSYGPWYVGGDHASEKDENFPVIRRINYAIGGIEDILHESRVRPAEVAMLYAMPTDVWTWGHHGANTAWLSEHIGLFLALQHAQIPVEILAEEDVVGGELANFKVLYIVGPNITSAAAGAIADWVRRGGTLVGTAAAGSRDEYDRPLATLEPVFGARQGEARFATIPRGTEKLHELPLLDHVVGENGHYENAGLRVALAPVDRETRVDARFFSDDAPALLERNYGHGRAMLFAGLPGLTYLRGGTLDKEENPGRYADCYSPGVYPAALRAAIATPALGAGARPCVEVGLPVVEAGLRESENGAVVVLVNYPRQPLTGLKLLIHGISADHVRSIMATTLGIELPFAPCGDNAIEVVLPSLTTTEMLAIRY